MDLGGGRVHGVWTILKIHHCYTDKLQVVAAVLPTTHLQSPDHRKINVLLPVELSSESGKIIKVAIQKLYLIFFYTPKAKIVKLLV